jgi:hypothetical protein
VANASLLLGSIHRQKLPVWDFDGAASVEPNRKRLRRIVGVVGERLPIVDLERVATVRDLAVECLCRRSLIAKQLGPVTRACG